MPLRGLRTPSHPPHTLNLRKVSHNEAPQAAAAARRSCCFASRPDYDSSKLGQFFTSDAVGASRAMQVPGTAGCSTQIPILVLANPTAWHVLICPLLRPPRHWQDISSGPCKTLSCAGHADSIWAARTTTAPEAENQIYFS